MEALVYDAPGSIMLEDVEKPPLLRMTVDRRLKPKQLVAHRFALRVIMKAHDPFENAGSARALKAILAIPPIQYEH
jgi:hypothetical protein